MRRRSRDLPGAYHRHCSRGGDAGIYYYCYDHNYDYYDPLPAGIYSKRQLSWASSLPLLTWLCVNNGPVGSRLHTPDLHNGPQ